MDFIKFLFKVIIVTSMVICAIFTHYYMTDIKLRSELKKECSGETCPCFDNIVDYRLTKSQAKSFLLYLKSRKVRPETKIMEFTDFDDAKQIMEMFSVCQLEQIRIQQEEEQETQPAPEVESEEGEEV